MFAELIHHCDRISPRKNVLLCYQSGNLRHVQYHSQSDAFTLRAFVGQEAAADDWSLSRDRDGIAVYTKTMQIDDGSEQLAYRGVASFNVSMSKLISAMRDVEHFDQWLHNCYEPRLLDQIAPETRMVYQKARTLANSTS